MKTTRLVLFLALLAFVQPVCAADPSPEIQQVLKERLVGKYDLKLDGLTKATLTPAHNKKLEDKSSYEVFHVPYPKRAADYFAYSIYRFNVTGEIWIIRSGGYAAVHELYVIKKPRS